MTFSYLKSGTLSWAIGASLSYCVSSSVAMVDLYCKVLKL